MTCEFVGRKPWVNRERKPMTLGAIYTLHTITLGIFIQLRLPETCNM
jgi:hypothetical protein